VPAVQRGQGLDGAPDGWIGKKSGLHALRRDGRGSGRLPHQVRSAVGAESRPKHDGHPRIRRHVRQRHDQWADGRQLDPALSVPSQQQYDDVQCDRQWGRHMGPPRPTIPCLQSAVRGNLAPAKLSVWLAANNRFGGRRRQLSVPGPRDHVGRVRRGLIAAGGGQSHIARLFGRRHGDRHSGQRPRCLCRSVPGQRRGHDAGNEL
jgi:hypothetical protein